MKATIFELWETGREIVTFDDSDVDRPQSFADLKKCDNVLLGDKIQGTRVREVLVDDSLVFIEPTKVRHPSGGTIYVLEVL